MRLGLIFVALVLFLAEQRQFTHKSSANRTAAHHKSPKLSANAITVTVMKLKGISTATTTLPQPLPLTKL